MNNRERTLALILIGFMALAAGGFVAYQFIYSPWKKANQDIDKLGDELTKLKKDLREIQESERHYEADTKRRSLPLDETVAQRGYEQLLDRMLRNANFQAPSITPRASSVQNVPTIGNKKPLYKKLGFDVKVKGGLETLVDFLFAFYSQPVLHQIRMINVLKPLQGGAAVRGQQERQNYDLDISFTVEALVLDQAEDRPTLMPVKPVDVIAVGGIGVTAYNARLIEKGDASVLSIRKRDNDGKVTHDDCSLGIRPGAETSAPALKEYVRIARKDIFFGTPPVSQSQGDAQQRGPDLSPYLCLVQVWHTNGRNSAMIKDRFNNEDYEIEEDLEGKIKVAKYRFVRHPEENGQVVSVRSRCSEEGDNGYDARFLTFGEESKGNERSFVVRRVLENGILVQEYDENRVKMMKRTAPLAFGGTANLILPGKVYLWEAGQLLKSQQTGKSVSLVLNPQVELIRPLKLINEKTHEERPEKVEQGGKQRFGRNR